jgi:succinyl-CoA synthetase alpha subunit
MSVLVNKSTRVMCQCFTRSQGTFTSEHAMTDTLRLTPQAQQ